MTRYRTIITTIIILSIQICALADEHVYPKEVRVTTLLKTSTDNAGRKIEYPKGDAELSAVLVEFPVGAQTGWHTHIAPCAAYILEGEIQLELKDGSKRVVREGEAFAEVVELLHNGRNLGPKPVKLILFVAGQKDSAYTIKK